MAFLNIKRFHGNDSSTIPVWMNTTSAKHAHTEDVAQQSIDFLVAIV